MLAIGQCFDEDSEFYIDQEELMEGQNLTRFIHAMANLVPNIFFTKLTGQEKNNLEFNHLANTLCFQYSTKEKEDDKENSNEAD